MILRSHLSKYIFFSKNLFPFKKKNISSYQTQKEILFKNFLKLSLNKNNSFSFCIGNNQLEGKITAQIQMATNIQQLKKIFYQNNSLLNIINRSALLKKITVRPFDADQNFIKDVVLDIQTNWHQYQFHQSQKARAIANTICYMSRNKIRHELDHKFMHLNYYKLFQHTNEKQFVMAVTGLLKLQLLDKINQQQVENKDQTKKIRFDVEELIRKFVKPSFHPGLLISLWRNIIKYNKTNRQINNFFGNMLKTKHLKNYIKDYAYFVYCYANTLDNIDIDLSFTLLAYPKDIKIQKNNRLQAHEFSLLCQNLDQIQKIKGIFFDSELIELLRKSYINITNQHYIPLRNIANCLNSFLLLTKLQENTLYQTFNSFKRILLNQIKNIDVLDAKKQKKNLVDPISFVFLFDKLLAFHQEKFEYFDSLLQITFNYILKILKSGQLKQYPEIQFIRLMKTIAQTKKKIYSIDKMQILTISSELTQQLFKEIMRRKFEPKHFSYLMGYISTLQIRSKQFCEYASQQIKKMDQKSKKEYQLDVRLKQKCIVNKLNHRCLDCFNKQTIS